MLGYLNKYTQCYKCFLSSIATKRCFSLQHKMVFVVRKDLPMRKGKVAAQCAHAAVQAFKKAPKASRKIWDLQGQPKVVVGCADETELLDLNRKAKASQLNATLIKDAGKTQLQPGTYTVLGVGPGPDNEVDSVTGHLKLL